jgi:hypothetical protein
VSNGIEENTLEITEGRDPFVERILAWEMPEGAVRYGVRRIGKDGISVGGTISLFHNLIRKLENTADPKAKVLDIKAELLDTDLILFVSVEKEDSEPS